MEGAIGSHLLESLGRGVHGLLGGGEGACSQYLDVLGVADFFTGVNHLLLSFEKLLGKLPKLEDLSFDERVSQSSRCTVNEVLIQLSVLEYALPEWGKWRLGAVAWSSS